MVFKKRRKMNLTELKTGEVRKIKKILGDGNFKKKLENLGLREGVEITKVSAQVFKGPITLQIGTSKIAIGFNTARQILLEEE
jgi:ferrous iron transport protein A